MTQYRNLSKRRSSGAWQWSIIGFFPGLLCGGIIIFALFLSGVLQGFKIGPESTVVVTQVIKEMMVVTATLDANQPTSESSVMVVTATPSEEPTAGSVQILVPTATPQGTMAAPNTPVSLVGSPTAGTPALTSPESPEETLSAGSTIQSAPTAMSSGSGAPPALQGIISPMSSIPGSTFTMGTTPDEVLRAVDVCVNQMQGTCDANSGADSSPTFQVKLDAYQMEQTEVTFEQYVAFLNYLHSQGKGHRDGCQGLICIQTVNENPTEAVITFDTANYNAPPGLVKHPVYGVTWYGAATYCATIGRRLPTEAEWEFAARGSEERIYPWGNDWIDANAKTRFPREAQAGTVPVGSYKAGASMFGMYDMAGNVAEWVNDWYSETWYSEQAALPQPVLNPQGPPISSQKVLRGGSWDTLPFFARTVHRQSYFPAPDDFSESFPRSIGFRCAANVGADAAVSNGNIDPATLGVGTPTQAAPSAPDEAATPATEKRG